MMRRSRRSKTRSDRQKPLAIRRRLKNSEANWNDIRTARPDAILAELKFDGGMSPSGPLVRGAATGL